MLIVNLYGSPSAGKSVTRADVFSRLKKAGVNCEEVVEYAKKLVWQRRGKSLSCQPYIFGKQLHEIEVLRNEVDVVITDSPLLLSRYYALRHNAEVPQSFLDCVADIARSMNTMNYFITRSHPYQTQGRQQTEQESDQVSLELRAMLTDLNVELKELRSNETNAQIIADDVLAALAKY